MGAYDDFDVIWDLDDVATRNESGSGGGFGSYVTFTTPLKYDVYRALVL